MRTLAPAPSSFLDPTSGEPAFGAYAGPMPRVALARLGLGDRIARRKRWVYAAISAEDVWIALGVVRTGYASTTFAFACDVAQARMLAEHTAMGPTPAARVADDPHERGELARFSFAGATLAMTRSEGGLALRGKVGDIEVDAFVDESGGPPPISAIARVGEGLFDATEKRALLRVRGRARCGGRDVVLDDGVAGYDYTHGLLPRHTKWRWAFGLGRAASGERLGFNMVQGFVGQPECAAFLDDAVLPLEEPRFLFDAEHPERPWRLEGEGIDLAFEPAAIHAQKTNLVLVRSRFVQPVGTFRGSLRLEGKDLRVEGLPGVVEDQDVYW